MRYRSGRGYDREPPGNDGITLMWPTTPVTTSGDSVTQRFISDVLEEL
jgi:hypothetical protein